MTWQQAINAMETGERCRYRGMRVIVTAVMMKRKTRINTETAQPYCIGEPFCSVRLMGAGNSGGTMYEGRLEELMGEPEYLGSKKESEEHEQRDP